MIEFGKTLRAAREAKGLTVGQIAESTHMLSSIVQNLEEEDFSKIVAPIYGRGFVKLYCEAVGLDPKPLIDEFMEIFSGNRIPAIKERPVSTPPPEPTVADPIPAPPPPTPPTPISAAEPPLPENPILQTIQPRTEPVPPPPVAEPAPSQERPTATLAQTDLFAPPHTELPQENPPTAAPEPELPVPPRFSRYSTPMQTAQTPARIRKLPSLPPGFGRMVTLVAIVLVILTLVGLGLRALYRATTPAPSEGTPEPQASRAATPLPSEKPKSGPKAAAQPTKTPAAKANDIRTQRTPQKIPSLYID